MVGSAMVSSVLSTISTKNARQRPNRGKAAARSEGYSTGPARGAALAQMGASITMASVMFGLILHFQFE
jgi:hypothetical protein